MQCLCSSVYCMGILFEHMSKYKGSFFKSNGNVRVTDAQGGLTEEK